jgi:hypothetical protein
LSSAYADRPPAQPRIRRLLNRSEKGVRIDVQKHGRTG